MVGLEIPVSSSAAHFTQENEIFGETFFLEFEWIEREAFWVMHLSDSERTPIVFGLKLMPDWPLCTIQRERTSITFLLLPTSPNTELNRQTLTTSFVLTVCDAAV